MPWRPSNAFFAAWLRDPWRRVDVGRNDFEPVPGNFHVAILPSGQRTKPDNSVAV